MTVSYTDSALLDAVRSDREYPRNRSVTGYGGKIATRYRVFYSNRWRRVYVMQYSNSGTAYIMVKGEMQVLDIATEYALQGVPW